MALAVAVAMALAAMAAATMDELILQVALSQKIWRIATQGLHKELIRSPLCSDTPIFGNMATYRQEIVIVSFMCVV